MTTDQRLGDRIAAGREAEIFAWGDDAAGPAVVKLYLDDGHARGIDIEEAAMKAAKAAHAPAPAPLGRIEVDGRTGLIMERADGIDLLTQLDKKPWTVFCVGTTMARCHAALHETIAPAALPSVKERLVRHMRQSPLVPDDVREFSLNALESLPDGDRLCHGDFHPANIILSARGPVVIDWPNSARGDPHADVTRTLLMFRMGEAPEGSVGAVVKKLEGIGRKIILWRYLAEYRKHRLLDNALLDRWEIPVAAHRLTENIPEERAKLLALLQQRMSAPNT
jgi:aminoglycoside phosphotransferase (APT) family kinase protein